MSTVSACASHRHAASERTQSPMFALPPLSPLRAPTNVPSGTRRVGPSGNGGGRDGSGGSASSRVVAGEAMSIRVPSGRTATCGTVAASTNASRNTP